ncbi:iorA4 protein [Candidatus Vecturithrix granuli]|uniref:Indolepyruvate oxidoreductase subunit IorA n=1 Tax=Vecturithrix granuli TaxID=1499967 RepID=A0A081C9C5_VECG1|nr:iorA4 protein [Candidatus Vecturithrix granuli]
MKVLGDVLLAQEASSEIVMGNTALVRAMLEAGTRVITSYPGSPTPEIAEAIQSIPQQKRFFHFEFSTNEKVATEVAYGAALNGHLSTVFFKSVGLNVAADTFVQLAYMRILGGMIIVLGDDPGINSSQNEQDNRHYALMSYTPVFEPASPTEVYHFYKEAVKLAQDWHIPVIVRLTTHVCHAKEKVAFAAWTPIDFDPTPRFDVNNGPYIPITSKVFPMKRQALKNLAEVQIYSDHSALHHLEDHGNRQRGIITMGLPYLSLLDVLEEAQEQPDILKLAIVHPIPRQRILDFLKTHAEVKILEELDDVLEKEIKALAYDARLATRILGKLDPEDWVGEYTPDKTEEVLRRTWPDLLPFTSEVTTDHPYVPERPAQMCPGCGHRSAFYAIKKALHETDITVADIGCHTLGFLPPYEIGQALMCMGASNGIGSGLSLFQHSRKVVAFLGDSTFFHAGLPGIINALFNNHHITLILMENGTTAMTGHQDHPGSGRNVNDITEKIPVRRVLEGLGVKHIYEVDTYQQAKLTELVKQAIADDAFSVVIAKHPCMLKFTREQRKKSGYTPRRVRIDQDLCEQVHECVEKFACPTFTRLQDGRIEVNHDLCIGDGSCGQTCPVGAITSPQNV